MFLTFHKTMAEDVSVSNLKKDERIVFFTTFASPSEGGNTWNAQIHAWVHELEKAVVRRGAISAAMRTRYGLSTTTTTKANFVRRTKLIAADNERGKRIVVELCGQTFTLPETEPNGHAYGEFQLDSKIVAEHANGNELKYKAVLPDGDSRDFYGSVLLLPKAGISVISDFDDTVKITNSPDRRSMLDHTLYQDYKPVRGMSELYSAWARQGANLHFVSSSPWHLYEPFEEFLSEQGFPNRTMSLKPFRFKDKTLLNLFRKGTATKPAQIEPILAAFPHRRFILVGDTGQHDPEVYAAMAKKFPQQIERIYLRNVNNVSREDDRFREVFANVVAEKWRLFKEPADLPAKLEL